MQVVSKLIYNYEESRFVFRDERVKLQECVSREISDYWDALISSGKSYENGDIFTIDEIQYRDNVINFIVKKTNFAHYLYSNYKKNQIPRCRSIASNVLILTSDDFYVLATMSRNTALPKKIKFIGGTFSEDDLDQNILIPRKCSIRETREEIGVNLDDCNLVKCMTPLYFLTRENMSFVNVLFLTELNMNSLEIMRLFEEHKRRLTDKGTLSELSSVILLKNEKQVIKDFLDKEKDSLIDYMDDLFRVVIGESVAQNIVEYIEQ